MGAAREAVGETSGAVEQLDGARCEGRGGLGGGYGDEGGLSLALGWSASLPRGARNCSAAWAGSGGVSLGWGGGRCAKRRRRGLPTRCSATAVLVRESFT